MPPLNLFITATDTNAGKTYISAGILNAFNHHGHSTLAIKPIASGCHTVDDILYNDDAITLQMHSSIKLDYDLINPIRFAPAIAPHIAAELAQQPLTLELLNQKTNTALHHPADLHLVEGAGGYLTPLNDQETMADYIKAHNFKVILVVGMRLGCLNHAMLTMRALETDNANVIGWIANCIDPEMEYLQENIDTLKRRLSAPCLGVVGYLQRVDEAIYVALV